MSYHIFKSGVELNIELQANEISSGGQGRIYRIDAPKSLSGYCVKLYKDEHHANANTEKIAYMVCNKPANANMSNIRICWPEYIVYDNKGSFCGYAMLLAFEGSRDLKIIEIFSIGKSIAEKYPEYTEWHNKYELDSPTGFLNRLKMLHNWALATEIIHGTGKYVIVDLKPDNVLATADGKISIVDTDSFQITDGNKNFPGSVATPEYFAKFAKERHAQKLNQTCDCDCFALAISFYKILIGAHPYSGFKLLPPYNGDEYSDIASRIDAELFVFGKNKSYIELLRQNNMHERFAKLPQSIQSLFMHAFTQRLQPSSSLWRQTLKSIIEPGSRVRVPKIPKDINSYTNSEMRCLCVLVIDVSGSMKLCQNALNSSLKSFMSDLLHGRNGFREYSKEQVELAVIQFDSGVEVLRAPSLIKKGDYIPQLKVRGLKTNTTSALRQAMKVVDDQKIKYKSKGLSYYRPWIILLTDGNPNPYCKEDVESLIADVNRGIDEHKFMFTAIGIGTEVDKNFLNSISKGNYSYISRTNISEFFQTLSASMSLSGGVNPQDELIGTLNTSIDVDI